MTSKYKIDHQSSLNSFYEIKINSKILFPSISSLAIFEKLIQQYQPKGNHVFDIEIVSIMLDNGINHIATFNQKDFVNLSEVQILELSLILIPIYSLSPFAIKHSYNAVAVACIVFAVCYHYDGSSLFIKIGEHLHYFITVR